MDILISNASPLPIYRQIAEQIKKHILSGTLVEGEALPSIRVLAKELQLSVITTKNAYEELEKEGLIESIQGKGFFVSQKNKELIREKKMRFIEEKLGEVVDECKVMGIERTELIEMLTLLYDE